MAPGMNGMVGLLLAAGRSRRFGSDKLLQALPDGRRVFEASREPLAAATDHTLTLIRPGPSALRQFLEQRGMAFLEVPEADAGMGATLAAGIRATPKARGWIVALADMPALGSQTVIQVRQALERGASIAAPWHAGRRGHPVGFSSRWYDALAVLDGDQGARGLLQAHPEAITRVEVNDGGCLLDIDTPEALAAIWPTLPPTD